MTSRVESLQDAYGALGLEPADGLRAARRAFRARVKQLHPDVTEPTPRTLAELARIVAAMDRIRDEGPTCCLELVLTVSQARTGLTRTLRARGKPVLVRIPAGTCDGDIVRAVGEDAVSVGVRVVADPPQNGTEDEIERLIALDAFVDEFSRPSAHVRFARWIRKAQSAA